MNHVVPLRPATGLDPALEPALVSLDRVGRRPFPLTAYRPSKPTAGTRKQIRPVLLCGAETMDQVFPASG